MEKRREPRVEANEPVVVTALGHDRNMPMGGMVQDMSLGGLLMKLPEAIAAGTLVRIETCDMLVLGEAVRCETAGEEFRVAVKVRHSLRGLQDLVNLNRALLGTAEPQRTEKSPVDAGVPIMRE